MATIPLPAEVLVRLQATSADSHVEIIDDNARRPVISCSENCLPVLLVPFGSSWMKQFSCPSKEQKRMQQNHSISGTSKNRWDTIPSSTNTAMLSGYDGLLSRSGSPPFERTAQSLRRITSDSSVLASARSFVLGAQRPDAPRRYTSMESTGSPQSLRMPKRRGSHGDGGSSNSGRRDGDDEEYIAECEPDDHASATSTLASHFHPSLMPGGNKPEAASSQTSDKGSPKLRRFKHMDSFLLNVKKPYFYAPNLEEEEASSSTSFFAAPRKPCRSRETLNLPQHKYENGSDTLAQSSASHGNASWDNMPVTAPRTTRNNNNNWTNHPRGMPRLAMSSALSNEYSSCMGGSGHVNSASVIQKLPNASSFAAHRQTVSEQSLTSLMAQNKNSNRNGSAPHFPNRATTGPADSMNSQRPTLYKQQNASTKAALNFFLVHQLSEILEVDGDELDECPTQETGTVSGVLSRATLGVAEKLHRVGISGNTGGSSTAIGETANWGTPPQINSNNNPPLQNVLLGGPSNSTETPFWRAQEHTSAPPALYGLTNHAMAPEQSLRHGYVNKSELSDAQRQVIRGLMNKSSAQSGKSASLQNALTSHPKGGVPAFAATSSHAGTHPMMSFTNNASMLNNRASQFSMPNAAPAVTTPKMPYGRPTLFSFAGSVGQRYYDKSVLSGEQPQAVQKLVQARQSPQETSPNKAHAAPQIPRRRESDGAPDLSEAQRRAVRELMLSTTETSSRPQSPTSINHHLNVAPQIPHRRESTGAPDLCEAQCQAVRELLQASCLDEERLNDGQLVTSKVSEEASGVSDLVLPRKHMENVVDETTPNPQEAKESNDKEPRPLPAEEGDDMEFPPVDDNGYEVGNQTESANEVDKKSASSSTNDDDVDSCCEFSDFIFDLEDTSASSDGSFVEIFASSKGSDILDGSSDASQMFGESSTANVLNDSVVLLAEDIRETCVRTVAEADALSANSQQAQPSEPNSQCCQDGSSEGPVSDQHSPNNSTSNTSVDDSSAHDSDCLGELPPTGTPSSATVSNIPQDCNHQRRLLLKKSLSLLSFRGREESEETEHVESTRPKLVRELSAPLTNVHVPSRGLLRRLSSRHEQKNRRNGLTKSLSFMLKHVRDSISENDRSEPANMSVPPEEAPGRRPGAKRTTSMGTRIKNRLSKIKIAGKSLSSKNMQKSETGLSSVEKFNPSDDGENNSENRESHSSPQKRRSSSESVPSGGISVSPMVSKSMNFARQVEEVDDEDNVLSVDKNPGPILVPLVPS